jgi:uncharacterized membrane protein
MTTLRTLRKLVLGETWVLPLGIAAVVLVTALAVRPLLGDAWDRAGGFVLLGGVAAVLVASVVLSARPRR